MSSINLTKENLPVDKPFRMPVQDVYKFTNFGDQRRIIAGTIETGTIRPDDEIIFFPSGKKSRIKTVESFNRIPREAGNSRVCSGFYPCRNRSISRGERWLPRQTNPDPRSPQELRVNLFWLGKDPMVKDKEYLLKLGTAKVPVQLEEIHRVMDASDLHLLEAKDRIDRHDVAECNLKLKRAIAFDLAEEIAATGRFVIVDHYEISGGGIIREALEDEQAWVRDKVLLRDIKWEYSMLSPEQRAEKYHAEIGPDSHHGRKGLGQETDCQTVGGRALFGGKACLFSRNRQCPLRSGCRYQRKK